jgi:predicted transglutaminase-like cysteine proteinase
MRIVVVQDLNLGIAHAVLVVYLDGRALVLDNQIDDVVPAAAVRHYRPIYSINERHWWLHRARPGAGSGFAAAARRAGAARSRKN